MEDDSHIQGTNYSPAIFSNLRPDGICFAAHASGLYRSNDGGLTWRTSYGSLELDTSLATPAVALFPDFTSASDRSGHAQALAEPHSRISRMSTKIKGFIRQYPFHRLNPLIWLLWRYNNDITFSTRKTKIHAAPRQSVSPGGAGQPRVSQRDHRLGSGRPPGARPGAAGRLDIPF